jgi:hypothetical protein
MFRSRLGCAINLLDLFQSSTNADHKLHRCSDLLASPGSQSGPIPVFSLLLQVISCPCSACCAPATTQRMADTQQPDVALEDDFFEEFEAQSKPSCRIKQLDCSTTFLDVSPLPCLCLHGIPELKDVHRARARRLIAVPLPLQ